VHEPDHFDPSSQAATSFFPSRQPDVRTVANSLMLSATALEEKSIRWLSVRPSSGQRNREAERPGSLEIDDQFCLGTIVSVRVLKTELPLGPSFRHAGIARIID
jgi:hypothetical protein